MKNQDWLKEMLGVEVTMKGNKMMFGRGIEDTEDVEFFTLDLDEKSVTSVKTGEKFYPKTSQDLQDIVINIKEEQKIEEELHKGYCEPQVDDKWKIKNEFSNLLTFIGYIEDGCFDTLNQDSFLKIGYYVGNIQRDVKELRVKLMQLEETINNL